jgi:hypothetical protein
LSRDATVRRGFFVFDEAKRALSRNGLGPPLLSDAALAGFPTHHQPDTCNECRSSKA